MILDFLEENAKSTKDHCSMNRSIIQNFLKHHKEIYSKEILTTTLRKTAKKPRIEVETPKFCTENMHDKLTGIEVSKEEKIIPATIHLKFIPKYNLIRQWVH
uniref:Uncharacterized protein n=1 Tax=Araneus ventricosus TaxID=182803 RepID=A0A4Y1ZPS4_ARAVE|nr:hypothetical protein AVEN_180105-1 [Araneus ventricosus]